MVISSLEDRHLSRFRSRPLPILIGAGHVFL